MVWTKFGKVFLSISSGLLLFLISSGSKEEEVGEERCVATTNDASGQPMAGGERHRMASSVQILMHYSLFAAVCALFSTCLFVEFIYVLVSSETTAASDVLIDQKKLIGQLTVN